jgi:segregation and condensation protein B
MSDAQSPALPPPPSELPWVLEALLFVADEPQTLGALARATGVSDGAARRALQQLTGDYEARGLRVMEDGQRYQLVSAPDYAPYIDQLLGTGPAQRLTRAALETLTIIAYRQPCTRAEIEAIRGVNSDKLVSTLEQRGLIDNVGQAEGPGRPKLYRTTMKFFEHFGIRSAAELPPLPGLEEEEPAPAQFLGK